MTIDLVAAPNPITWQMTIEDIMRLREAKRVTASQIAEHVQKMFVHLVKEGK